MLSFLASFLPEVPPVLFMGVLGTAGWGLYIWNQIAKIRRGGKTEIQQPLSIELTKRLVTHDQFDEFRLETKQTAQELAARIKSVDDDRRGSVARCYDNNREMIRTMSDELGNDIDELRSQLREDVGGVHTRINEILSALSVLKGAFEESRRKS